MFGKRTAEPLQGSPAQKPSPFSTPSSSLNLFGQKSQSNLINNTNSPSIFNQNNQTGNSTSSLFSSNPNSTSSLFQSQPPPQSQSNLGLFSNPTPTSSHNLSGANSNTPVANNTVSPFGSKSLFSNTTPASQNNGLFAGTTTSQTNSINKSPSNPFNNTPSSTTQNSNSLFGTNSKSTSLFGLSASTNSTPAPSATQNPPKSNNLLLSSANQSLINSLSPSTNRSFSNLKASSNQIYPRPITVSEMSIQDRISKIYASWNVSDPQCQFQYFFYNVVPSDQVHLYGKPPQLAPDDPKWQRAKRNNPDPSRLVPTLAIGFEDLFKRVNVQQNQARLHLNKLNEISSKLNEIMSKQNLETTSRLHKLRTEQAKLSSRLISLVGKLSGLTSLGGPSGMIHQTQHASKREEELIERIKNLTISLEEGGKVKVGELWAKVNQLKTIGGPLNNESNGKWAINDEREIKKVLEVLLSQQKGIDHLTLLLRKLRVDVLIMRQSFNLESNLKAIQW
ncbi:hypothetical protein O181_043606 [Austropuccinia psidii MF-1]|uniref:Nucleoporin Nup54 alpha-helical domain-containing protein n=1 Tax=Austropuccinia psidii MF-1 TaxID=1389203 RepID=A0A9Q3HG51_9BASI|nr:hypothetical protein [Austropuccinia psidii MF-1]